MAYYPPSMLAGASVTAQAIAGALGYTPPPPTHTHSEYALTTHNHNGTYAAAAHGHAISEVTGLQAALDGKQASGSYALTSHNHDAAYSAIGHNHNGVYQPAGSYAAASHTHVIADVTGLQTALDGKQAAGSYAAAVHTHPYEPTIATGTTSQFWRGDKTWAVPPGASPYWNEITLGADFTNALITFSTITGMNFTPAANSNFEVQAALLIQTTTATNLPRIGVSIGAGQAFGAVQIDQTGATVTTRVVADGTFTTAAVNVQVPAGGVAAANTPYLCYVTIRGRAGASPGAIALQMAAESAAANVCFVKTGSQMRWKNS